MPDQSKVIAFDIDQASLISLRKALPDSLIEVVNGATASSLTWDWNPGRSGGNGLPRRDAKNIGTIGAGATSGDGLTLHFLSWCTRSRPSLSCRCSCSLATSPAPGAAMAYAMTTIRGFFS